MTDTRSSAYIYGERNGFYGLTANPYMPKEAAEDYEAGLKAGKAKPGAFDS